MDPNKCLRNELLVIVGINKRPPGTAAFSIFAVRTVRLASEQQQARTRSTETLEATGVAVLEWRGLNART